METNVKTGLDIDKIFSKLGYIKKDDGTWIIQRAENVSPNLASKRENFRQTEEIVGTACTSIEKTKITNQRADFATVPENVQAKENQPEIIKPVAEKTAEIWRAGLIEPLVAGKIKKVDKVAKEDYLDEVLRAV